MPGESRASRSPRVSSRRRSLGRWLVAAACHRRRAVHPVRSGHRGPGRRGPGHRLRLRPPLQGDGLVVGPVRARGSRSCRSTGGSGRRGAFPRPSRSSCRRPSWPAPPWPSRTPWPMSTATPRRASSRWRGGWAPGEPGPSTPSSSRSSWARRSSRSPGTAGRAPASAWAPVIAALAAGLVIAVGIALGRRGDAARRERAWEFEAVGVGLLAAAWLAAVPLAP